MHWDVFGFNLSMKSGVCSQEVFVHHICVCVYNAYMFVYERVLFYMTENALV